MFHRLCEIPPIPLSSNLAAVLLRRSVCALATYKLIVFSLQNTLKSGHGLSGYLIRVDPHAFALQRQFILEFCFRFWYSVGYQQI